jgi:hypothetical protein
MELVDYQYMPPMDNTLLDYGGVTKGKMNG